MLSRRTLGESTVSRSAVLIGARVIGIVWITLTGAACFSVQATFCGDVNHVLDLGLNRSLHGDEAAGRASTWLFVQVVEVPAMLEPEREPMQCVDRSDSANGAAAPEKNVPGAHDVSPFQKNYSHRSGIGRAQWWPSPLCDDLSDRNAAVRNGDWPAGRARSASGVPCEGRTRADLQFASGRESIGKRPASGSADRTRRRAWWRRTVPGRQGD